jgi:transposase
MGKPYPRELRERVLAACASGKTQPEVAALYGVGRTTIVKWLMLQRETGDIEPRGHAGGTRRKVCPEILSDVLGELPDGTRAELTARYNERVAPGDQVHESSLYRALRREGYVSKKNGAGRQSRRGQTS